MANNVNRLHHQHQNCFHILWLGVNIFKVKIAFKFKLLHYIAFLALFSRFSWQFHAILGWTSLIRIPFLSFSGFVLRIRYNLSIRRGSPVSILNLHLLLEIFVKFTYDQPYLLNHDVNFYISIRVHVYLISLQSTPVPVF